MLEWLIVLSYQFVIFGSVKNDITKLLLNKKLNDAGNRR